MISRLLAGRWGPAIWMTSLTLLGIASMIPFRLPGSLLDKMLHFLAYFALSTLAFKVWPIGCRLWLATVLLLMLGAGIEIAQLHLAGREASWLDMASNALGIGTAVLFTFRLRGSLAKHLVSRRVPPVRTAANPKSYRCATHPRR
ncbi:VanZ family protein [Desulfocurvibacter africanus]|uniref:VanZ family protein n=1 Tax=Desulfocurvibacter africanus TaxID=873 RepID=UPI002FDA03A3